MSAHNHVFLGAGHQEAERRTWAVIWLCGAMMVLEIGGGALFGSIALVADGLHMSTHAGALLLAALAYRYARKFSGDPRFSFGTGKLGDLAGFTSAIILGMISLLIAYEAVSRLIAPVPIHYGEAIPIAALGLCVNVASAWILAAGGGHHHHHGHGHDDHHDHHDDAHIIRTESGTLTLSIFETDHPPVFRITGAPASDVTVQTRRADGSVETFSFGPGPAGILQSVQEIPEPHAFTAVLSVGDARHEIAFAEHEHGGHDKKMDRDNNMRAAVIHIFADAAVSVLVILGLVFAKLFGWTWMDPLVGLVGAVVIATWALGLVRDTGAILLDMVPSRDVADTVRTLIEAGGDSVTDLHLWRLGPGHLGAIISVSTPAAERNAAFYRAELLARIRNLSHVTVEVEYA
jgi:cation diffusion facilitator family transporter